MAEEQPASSTATRKGRANGKCSFVSNRIIVLPSSCQSLFASRGRLCLRNAACNNARVTCHKSHVHVAHQTSNTSHLIHLQIHRMRPSPNTALQLRKYQRRACVSLLLLHPKTTHIPANGQLAHPTLPVIQLARSFDMTAAKILVTRGTSRATRPTIACC